MTDLLEVEKRGVVPGVYWLESLAVTDDGCQYHCVCMCENINVVVNSLGRQKMIKVVVKIKTNARLRINNSIS